MTPAAIQSPLGFPHDWSRRRSRRRSDPAGTARGTAPRTAPERATRTPSRRINRGFGWRFGSIDFPETGQVDSGFGTESLAARLLMTPFETAILAAYFFVLAILAVYGWHRYYLVYLYTKYRHNVPQALPPLDPLPVVTVQLPLYNEMYVVDRLVEAVCRMDYPRHLLEIQVLDDSTDETREIGELAVRRYRAQGFDIHYVHRTDRTGYKAGALAAGLHVARGDLIAVFDADFVPPVDFLRRALPHFVDPQVGMVQARWGHINENYSLLTKIQAILLDAHFVLEHGGRNRAGCFFNFNGTAGVWRRTAIAAGGGWQHDTLTEDLDLSYRAQLRGWRFVFLPDLVAPAEVPVEMNAFKSQQHRWAKGSIQTMLKLLPRLLSAPIPLRTKAEAFFHLTANVNYLLMIALSVLMFPAMYVRYNMGWYEMLLIDVPFFFAATWSVAYFYMACQRELYPDSWLSRLKYLPFLMSIGIGLAVNNARAVLEALFGKQTEFARTAKYAIERTGDDWSDKKYRQTMAWQPLLEVLLGLYFTATVFYALSNQIYGSLPFLILFQVGFLYTGLLSLLQQYAGDDVMLGTEVVK
jgi:cellulose synthase/poly-beta-1,6-N-acetylglucosamine synthase-like glycosyltransferase